ncbi:MAG: FKBP-type peptidyl-prolyl cis-trans isomerase [Eggerthellaceae bacterium]|nr:FKBP-type peptidyl-prolyl cis-trans isomerase [Eggerthellaceae bacterium]
MVAVGSKVSVHYVGTFDDGTEFDNSYKLGEMLEFVIGGGHMITGFDKAVSEMEVGERRSVRLAPEEAYGEWRSDFVEPVPCEYLPNWEDLPLGEPVVLQAQNGQQIQVLVSKVEDGVVYLDHNHFLAGKPINFEIELVEVAAPGSFEHVHDDDCDCGCHDHARDGHGAHGHEEHARNHDGHRDHEHSHGESCSCGCH